MVTLQLVLAFIAGAVASALYDLAVRREWPNVVMMGVCGVATLVANIIVIAVFGD